MDKDWGPIVLPDPKRLRRLRWIWLALVVLPLFWLSKNWQPIPLTVLLCCAAAAWCWYVYFDLKPPFGLHFDSEGGLALVADPSLRIVPTPDVASGEPATVIGSQFFEHWIALQIRLPNRPRGRNRLFLLLSGADAWRDNDWHTLRVRLLHLKNRSSAA